MSAFANHFAFEFKSGLRNANQLLMNYLFPLGFYVMMALLMTEINPLFREAMVPAMVVFAATATPILGLPGPLVESREAGIYRSYKINGVPAAAIVSIPALGAAIHVIIVSAIIALTGPAFGGVAPSNWGAFSMITLVMVFTCVSLGMLIGVISTNSRATVLWSQLIFLPSMLLGGMMVPADILPASVRPISALLPATHAMQAYLGLAYDKETLIAPMVSVGILLLSGALAFGLAIYLFDWDTANRTRRGHPLMALLAYAPFVAGMFLMH